MTPTVDEPKAKPVSLLRGKSEEAFSGKQGTRRRRKLKKLSSIASIFVPTLLAFACSSSPENNQETHRGDGGSSGDGDIDSKGSGGTASNGGGTSGGSEQKMGPDAYKNDCTVSGDYRVWHRVAVACEGPEGSENGETFTDFRMQLTFSNGSQEFVVPGHFAADADAANSGATEGKQWRAYFMPPSAGKWSYSVSFRSGAEIAVSTEANAGTAEPSIDGKSGAFDVADSDKSGRDMRAHGLLQHAADEHYLRHAGSGRVYIEGGSDSPENLFGYDEIDNTSKMSNVGSCKGILHEFASHESDWETGDPSWDGGRGKSLIGVVNYLASTGLNAIYLVPLSENGDGCDAHPYAEYGGEHLAFDVSKLDQWEMVFEHMNQKGLNIHFVTQETENDQLLDGGDLGLTRKLYYREMISRFAHHPALQWNLGEENTNTKEQQTDFANYIKLADPYDHPVFMHTYPGDHDKYDDLLGLESFDGPTLQYGAIPESAAAGLYGETLEWIEKSAMASPSWVVTATEASGGDAPTPHTEVTPKQRIYWMYANPMAGGGGIEWYLKNDGAGHAYDLAVEDLREFDNHWQQTGHLVNLYNHIIPDDGVDLSNLQPHNELTSSTSDWVLANEEQAFLIYLREGGQTDLTLNSSAEFKVSWFNPRTGKVFDAAPVSGPGQVALGQAPSEPAQDWVIWVRR